MLLTKRELRRIMRNFRVIVPPEVEEELLEQYGHLATDEEGHLHDYTEQDICEGLRKRLYAYQNSQQQMRDKPVMMTE